MKINWFGLTLMSQTYPAYPGMPGSLCFNFGTILFLSWERPVMILDYNRYKGGFNNMDKWLAEYSTKRRTNRWSLAFFYNVIDVICMDYNPHLKKSTSCRGLFLQQLSERVWICGTASCSLSSLIFFFFCCGLYSMQIASITL